MTDPDVLERRLAAVERTLVDGDCPPESLPEAGTVAEDIDRLDARLEDVETRVAELEGATEALRGYVGNVRSVNEDVERRADAAVATVDRLERRVSELERAVSGGDTSASDSPVPRATQATDGGHPNQRIAETVPVPARAPVDQYQVTEQIERVDGEGTTDAETNDVGDRDGLFASLRSLVP